MRYLVFDTGPLITLVMNNLLWILEPLKKSFGGEFFICDSVKKELVDDPLKTKKFKFEAMVLFEILKKEIIKITNEDLNNKTNKLLDLANNIFKARGEWIRIVHRGEMESLALASYLEADAYVVDERTTRLLVENPKKLAALLEKKLHTRVEFNGRSLRAFQKEVGKINIIRSAELVMVAYELGLLDKYLPKQGMEGSLVDGLLWGVKLRGCSISSDEIDNILKIETR